MARNKKNLPWLKETSDRSGFDNFDRFGKKLWTSIKQNGLSIAPEEYDSPPPSTKSLGGADISGTPRTNADSTAVPSVSTEQIQYITAAGGILVTDEPYLLVSGSLTTVNITANPQIQLGRAQQIVAVMCIGSAVTLETGSGLALTAGKPFRMQSGGIINLICSRTDNLWHELSRVEQGGI